MKNMIRYFGLTALAFLGSQMQAKEPATKQNVLFIIVDDLRPQLGCYGNTTIKTPNIDKLAGEGYTFLNNYCNYPVCGPSRASIFSGMRPSDKRFTGNDARVDKEAPGIVPMNTFFLRNGYQTVSLGKVYHNKQDSKEGWSVTPWGAVDNDSKRTITGWRDYITPENQELCKTNSKRAGYPYEIAEVEDDAYYDGKTALKAIEHLNNFSKENKPFFLTVGFVKPHLPFNSPKKYYDLYPEGQIKLPENDFTPGNAPVEALNNWPELRAYCGIPAEGPLDKETALKLIRGYNACTSYSDAMIGRVINELKRLKLDKSTVVVLIGDHGWHLGEHTLWCKHSNFRNVLRTTLIVKDPAMKGGKQITAGTELVDVYPTIADLSGNTLPGHLEGNSLKTLMNDPGANWKEAVYSIFENAWSVKTDRYLYTEWIDANRKATARMLYDHKNDPQENKNIAEEPSMKEVVSRHAALLRIYYNKSNEGVSSGKITREDDRSLRDIVADVFPKGNVYIGCASHRRLFGTPTIELLDREFSYVTPSNEFKQTNIHPLPDKWQWDQANDWIAHCTENKQVIRLHSPISPQCSEWARDDNRTRQEMEKMLEAYMTALCKKYNETKDIKWMDVVNETINADGTWFGPKEGTKSWENPWTILGFDESVPLKPPLYIEKAFQIANKNAPAIKQIINQHGAFEEAAWEKMKALVTYLRSKGIRIDGIGWQAHIEMGWEKIPGNPERLAAIVDWCHSNQLEFHITEFNVWLKAGNESRLKEQAETFAAVSKIVLDRHNTGLVGINFWQIRGSETMHADWNGCLFSEDFQPKPAYKTFKQLLISYKK